MTAASICYLESSFRLRDCAAILWSAAKRARVRFGSPDWFSAFVRYSSPALMASSERAGFARTLPWGDVWGASPRFNAGWQRLREFVERVLGDRDPRDDPCPSATYFGGAMDARRGRMVPAKCAGAMANTFYQLARR